MEINKSNAMEIYQPMITKINDYILYFYAQNYSKKSNFSAYYKKMTDKLKTMTFKIEKLDSRANYESTQNVMTFNENYDFNDIDSFIGTYTHEFGHFLSRLVLNDEKIESFEEGFADFFSDTIVDFINDKDLLKLGRKIKYKKTAYYDEASVIRNIMIISKKSPLDLLWEYQNISGMESDFYKSLSQCLSNESIDFLIDNDMYSHISKRVLDDISKRIEIVDFTEIPSILINNNDLLQKQILKKLAEQDIYTKEETKEKYSNIPEDLYDRHPLFFTNSNRLKNDAIKNLNSDDYEQKVNLFIDSFIDNLKIDVFLDNDAITNLINYVHNISIFTDSGLEIQNVMSMAIVIDIIKNKKEIDKEQYIHDSVTKVLNPIEDKYYYAYVEKLINSKLDEYEELSAMEVIEIFKNEIKDILKNYFIYEKKKENFEKGQISEIEILNTIKSFSNNKDNYPLVFVTQYFNMIFEAKFKENPNLSVDTLIDEYNDIVKELGIPYDFDIRPYIIKNANYDSNSLDFIRNFSKEKMLIVSNNQFDEIFERTYADSKKEINPNQIIELVNSLLSENFNYNNSQILYKDVTRPHCYTSKKMLENTMVNILSQLIELYKLGNKEVREYVDKNPSLFNIFDLNNFGHFNKNAKKLINDIKKYELKQLRCETDQDISYDNIDKLLFKNVAINEKEKLDFLNNTPYLKNLYLKSIRPDKYTLPKDINKSFSICDWYEKYKKLKDILPEIAIEWKNKGIEYNNMILELDDNKILLYNDYLYNMAEYLERFINDDFSDENETFKEQIVQTCNKIITIIDNNLLIKREDDYYLMQLKKEYDTLKQKYSKINEDIQNDMNAPYSK